MLNSETLVIGDTSGC